MRRFTRRLGAQVALAALLVLGSIGCAESDPQLLLRGSAVFDGQLDTDTNLLTCSLTIDPQAADIQFFGTGSLDLTELGAEAGQIGPIGFGGKDRFDFVAVLSNTLQPNAGMGQQPTDFDNLRVDTNIIEIQEIQIRFPTSLNSFQNNVDSAVLDEYFELSPRFISAVVNGGFGTVFPISIISSPAEKQLFEQFHVALAGDDRSQGFTLISELQVLGESIDGGSVESNIVRWPISFCRACDSLGLTPTCVVTQ